MSGRVKKPAAPKKKAKGYRMPAPIPAGEVIHDNLMKKKWRIGPSIGVGGFGEIYSACEHENSPKKGSNYPFVVKIEPHENGPLFVEINFYVRNAKGEEITKFMKSHKLRSLGMPTYYGHGSHEYKGEKYRYLVLERYGKDVWSLFKDCGRTFPPATVFQIGLQMLDILEYIHSRGYVHADIKGANILLGLRKGTESQAYLVDFGLATRVGDKEFKPDPKCAHNGTIEYTSRDAHLGVATMRGDLEILGYNMLQWLVGELPWEKALKQPKAVQEMKESFMKSVRSSITKLSSQVPEALIKFFEYINTIKPKDIPDHKKCKHLFESFLKSFGKTISSKLEFTPTKKLKGKVGVEARNSESEEEKVPKKKSSKQNGDVPVVRRVRKTKVTQAENCDSEEPESSIEKPRKVKRIAKRKPSPKETSSDAENCENEQPDGSITKARKTKTTTKRKSTEPALLVKVKKTKLAPKVTPPIKRNHANTATQTSIDKPTSVDRTGRSPRQVSFDSPICAIIGGNNSKVSRDNSTANSSGDIIEDSFVIEDKKVKSKRKLLSDEEVVTRVVKKKITTVPEKKSWKDSQTIVNGRSPPK